MADVLQQVSTQLQARLNEIDAEERQLRNALLSLAGSPAGTNGTETKWRKSSGPGARKVARPRKARAAKGQRRAEVSAILQANPKAKTSEIARQIGISTNQVSGLRRQLATSGEPKAAKAKTTKAKIPRAAKGSKGKAAKPKAAAKRKRKAKAAKAKTDKPKAPKATG